MKKFIVIIGIVALLIGGFLLFKFLTKPVHVIMLVSDNQFVNIVPESVVETESEITELSEIDGEWMENLESDDSGIDASGSVNETVFSSENSVENSVENVDNSVESTTNESEMISTTEVLMPTPGGTPVQWILIGNVKVALDASLQYDAETSASMMNDPSVTLFMQQFAEYKGENKMVMLGFSVAGKENDVESFMQTVEDYLFGNGSDYERTFEEELTTGNFNGIKHTFLSSDRTTCNIVYGCYTGQGIIYLVVHSLYDSNSDADFNKIAFSMTSVSA